MTHYVVFQFQHKGGGGCGWATLQDADFSTRLGIEEAAEAIIALKPDLYESVIIMDWKEIDG
jgi:hypothetical protein